MATFNMDNLHFPSGSVLKNPSAKHESSSSNLGQEDPLEKKWKPTPIFVPGKFHGQQAWQTRVSQGHKGIRYKFESTQQQQHVK